ncbi:MAG TPA: hypothetical protein VNJ08_14890 [Bacteriovoracaceae bacterium]|nr:hypothetical protein [Bacteriovoracaceae bacterium]
MKMTSIFFLFLLIAMNGYAAAEPKREIDLVPPTPEENFYDGDQVNPEAFSNGAEEERQEEEAVAPYSPHEEIYPYENLEMDREEEYLEDDY